MRRKLEQPFIVCLCQDSTTGYVTLLPSFSFGDPPQAETLPATGLVPGPFPNEQRMLHYGLSHGRAYGRAGSTVK